jgi:hypothetical protein
MNFGLLQNKNIINSNITEGSYFKSNSSSENAGIVQVRAVVLLSMLYIYWVKVLIAYLY